MPGPHADCLLLRPCGGAADIEGANHLQLGLATKPTSSIPADTLI